ncbi:hypothetical protein Tco_0044128 [Tanacetum coccineum]
MDIETVSNYGELKNAILEKVTIALQLARLTKKIERAFLAWLVKSNFWPYLSGDGDEDDIPISTISKNRKSEASGEKPNKETIDVSDDETKSNDV